MQILETAQSSEPIFPLQSSNLSTYMPKKMIHPIASLVNPHAQLAAIEAQQAEQEYLATRGHSSMSAHATVGSRIQYSG